MDAFDDVFEEEQDCFDTTGGAPAPAWLPAPNFALLSKLSSHNIFRGLAVSVAEGDSRAWQRVHERLTGKHDPRIRGRDDCHVARPQPQPAFLLLVEPETDTDRPHLQTTPTWTPTLFRRCPRRGTAVWTRCSSCVCCAALDSTLYRTQ